MKLKIKKGDSVEVITGSEKGKRGTVLEIDRQKMRIRIQGVRMQTHFDKEDGRREAEGFLAYSNVKLAAAAAPAAAKKTKKKTATAK